MNNAITGLLADWCGFHVVAWRTSRVAPEPQQSAHEPTIPLSPTAGP
jgi:hypothetical protein